MLDRVANTLAAPQSLQQISPDLGKEMANGNEKDALRPALGHGLTDAQIKLTEKYFGRLEAITRQEKDALDSMLVRNNRFFSMFDSRARVTMYNYCHVERFEGQGTVIEGDTESTDHLSIILRGRVN